ncbi:Gfo/Idh/MocA family protein [Mucilaginibacter auburnensis]|uniref:Putative dehydrogenase n=1 Tax=Mucilaginibacter auburnensis TaxID=1457233 RepID=A0A2H9VUS4_9SPHI|nr:Gfo/Idh/MocA family oxidoreductase [Mucilaginibacter auburnensis]PJJ84580.1 putative dehydrogenase [Mucilaginibacter auburnensis]
MGTVNWGIIGCGDVTEVKSGPPLYKVPNSRLAAVMRRDAVKAEDYARRHGVGKWYNNAYQLLDDKEINAVYIATPPSSHMEYALAAIERGLNVYIDKPVTLNAEQARQIASALKHSSSKVSVAHYRRALPSYLYIKDLLASGAIGDVRSVQIRTWKNAKPEQQEKSSDNWRTNPHFSGGGYFHDLSPHQLDLMLFYFGVPVKYSGFSINQAGAYHADDHTSGNIIFGNGVVVNGSWCFNVTPSEFTDECVMVGSKGSISFPFFNEPYTIRLKTEQGETAKTFVQPEHIAYPMIEKVVNYFNNNGENPSDINDAIVVMEIIDTFAKKAL